MLKFPTASEVQDKLRDEDGGYLFSIDEVNQMIDTVKALGRLADQKEYTYHIPYVLVSENDTRIGYGYTTKTYDHKITPTDIKSLRTKFMDDNPGFKAIPFSWQEF